jgi:hypothetical protein
MSSRPRNAALKTSQLPRHPSIHLEHSPLHGTTLGERLAVLVASLPLGLLKFIINAPFLDKIVYTRMYILQSYWENIKKNAGQARKKGAGREKMNKAAFRGNMYAENHEPDPTRQRHIPWLQVRPAPQADPARYTVRDHPPRVRGLA